MSSVLFPHSSNTSEKQQKKGRKKIKLLALHYSCKEMLAHVRKIMYLNKIHKKVHSHFTLATNIPEISDYLQQSRKLVTQYPFSSFYLSVMQGLVVNTGA